MRSTTLIGASALLLSLPLALAASRQDTKAAAGVMAPEISAQTWFNHIGQSPDLASLRGKAVLLEFWATW